MQQLFPNYLAIKSWSYYFVRKFIHHLAQPLQFRSPKFFSKEHLRRTKVLILIILRGIIWKPLTTDSQIKYKSKRHFSRVQKSSTIKNLRNQEETDSIRTSSKQNQLTAKYMCNPQSKKKKKRKMKGTSKHKKIQILHFFPVSKHLFSVEWKNKTKGNV